ncbi:hypothetical protein SAMN05421736_102322 [Evansella caseinilytica]|uniref:Uncharacterized protein n=1 Tax=Evansella caseinilytica TaxID=1503961 RepID=A0A1H3L227_9BACI|nr:hypothetical protein SAMN05421736_102322 [Evansella caseinilytica]
MDELIRSDSIHDFILLLINEVLARYKQNAWPSPTIQDLSRQLGYSEEMILESLEFGNLPSVGILQ